MLSKDQRADLTPEQLITEFNKGRVPAEFWVGFKKVLQEQSLNPTMVLLKLFDQPVEVKHLLFIGMCLRYGANPNAYIAVENLGKNLHLLPLLYTKMMRTKSDRMIDMVVLMFMMTSDVMSKRAEDAYAGQIRSDYTPYQTVRQWFIEHKYPIVQEYQERGLEKVVPPETLMTVRILLDKCPMSRISTEYNDRIVKSLSEGCAQKMAPSNEKILWNDRDLLFSFRHLNLATFKALIRKGKLPTYPLMNQMILQAQLYLNDRVDYAQEVMYEMILESVRAGYRIDTDQNALISAMGDDEFFGKVQEAFGHPLWEKLCSNPVGNVPHKLRELAVSLGIPNATKTEICTTASSLASQNDKSRILAEFRNKNVLHPQCNNRAMLPYDQDEYSDLEIVHYTDARGSNWCFTSDMYNSLVERQLNIFTLEPLTDDALFELKSKRDILVDMGLSLNPKPLDERLSSLWDTDVVEDNYQQVEHVQNILNEHGVSAQQYQNVTEEAVEKFLKRYGIHANLTQLTRRHFKITLVWVVKWIYNNNHAIYEKLLKVFQWR